MQKKVLSHDEIIEICQRLGKEITEVIKSEKKIPVFVGILKGSVNFMMDLLKFVTLPIYTDYIQISSYESVSSTGRVRLVKDLSYDCNNRIVFIIEDIIDTGTSMKYLLEHIKSHNPKKVYVVALFDKAYARKNEVVVDFVGKKLEDDAFLVGYGLDYNELLRNIPEVYAIEPGDVDLLNDYLARDKM